jgi:hypothetical protein
LLLQVQTLAQKFDAPFQQGPAWVHVAAERISNPSAGQTYPPPYLKTDMWYEIDADGYVTRTLWTDRDKAGLTLQQSATVGNYFINFTSGESGHNDGQSYRVSLDLLTKRLGGAVHSNTRLLTERSTCENGDPCLLITMSDAFAQPSQNQGEAQPYYGAGSRVWIDLQTGLQVKNESFWLLKDDKEALTSTYRVLSVEKVASPPQEILNTLAKVVVP